MLNLNIILEKMFGYEDSIKFGMQIIFKFILNRFTQYNKLWHTKMFIVILYGAINHNCFLFIKLLIY
jgi:hypothetical protein